MGNISCKECLDKEISAVNEILVDTKIFNDESEEDINRNTRSVRLKILKTNHQENDIINVESSMENLANNYKSPSQKKNFQKVLRKEEKDNNLLLRTELNKIKELNINSNNLYKSNNSNDISKLIELQRKKILAQEKIIEEYKNKESLFEEQQKKIEQTQKIIREQQSLLNQREIQNKKTQILMQNHIKNNIPIIKSSPTEILQRNKKKIITPSKSTPLIKANQNIKNNYIKKFNNNIQELNKFERTQQIKPNFVNIYKGKDSRGETLEENEENQIEDNDNYERIDDNEEDEENNNINLQLKSQRFKIETYEPIESGNKIENNKIMNNYKELNDIVLEPRDSIKDSTKQIISNNNYNDNYNKLKKIEIGPRDNCEKNEVNINFRGTFENTENDNKTNIKREEFNKNKMNYKVLGPRDSKRKGDVDYNYNKNNKDFSYIVNNNIYNDNEEYINEVLIKQQEQFNNEENQYLNKFDNNIYFSKDYSYNIQQESPKFNSRNREEFHSSMKNDDDIEIEKYGNSTYGPYLNDVNNINLVMSADPVIYHKDNQEQHLNQTSDVMYRPNLNYNINDIDNVENNIENPLI